VGTIAGHRGVSFSFMGIRYHPARVDRHECSEAGRPCQRRPGDPCARGKARMSHMQASPAILSRPLWEHTPTPRPRCAACCPALLWLTDLSGSPLNAVGGTPPWHHRHVETTDAVWDIECSGARPVRRAPALLAKGERIVQRLFTRGPLVTGSTARRAPDSGPRTDPRPLCLADDRKPGGKRCDRPRAGRDGRRPCDRWVDLHRSWIDGHERGPIAGEAGDAMKVRRFDGFGAHHRRQDGGEPPRQDRLTRSRGLEQEEVMVRMPASSSASPKPLGLRQPVQLTRSGSSGRCHGQDHDGSASSALASCRSAVSKPSVNQP
jgi:hypothetical protein